MGYFLIAAMIFGLCFLLDKGFTKLFRSKPQHKSGRSVKLHKYFAAGGILLTILGLLGMISGGRSEDMTLLAGSVLVALIGIGLIVYYLTFGVYYDDETFIHSAFGKKSIPYHYRDIRAQQLYRSGKAVVIELQMTNGKTLQLQSSMEGVYPFLDQAFTGWCRQRGIDPATCSFHDPENSCWFPSVEGE